MSLNGSEPVRGQKSLLIGQTCEWKQQLEEPREGSAIIVLMQELSCLRGVGPALERAHKRGPWAPIAYGCYSRLRTLRKDGALAIFLTIMIK